MCFNKGGRPKKIKHFSGDMSPIRGGSTPLPLKKMSTFFRQNVKNILHARKKNFFVKKRFLYCHPLSEYRFNKTCIKKGEKTIFLSPKWAGGQSLG